MTAPVRPTTITPGRAEARTAIHMEVGGKFSIADVMAAMIDVLTETVGFSFETVPEAEICARKIGEDIAVAVRNNWQELTWARQLVHQKPEGRS